MNNEFQTGLDTFINNANLRAELKNRRIALLGHPASVLKDYTHALDALAELPDINLTAAFGPQHGLRGDKQDNMMETKDEFDSRLKIPVYSLYGEVRRPTEEMMNSFDVLLIDLQDLGCRIYTFITTLRYVLEAASAHKKAVWVLDRPNPAGREIEGLALRAGWESFVGAGEFPMRHGLTMGEMGAWFIKKLNLDVEYKIIKMRGYKPNAAPHFGWTNRPWLNPSPNAASLNMARSYAGTVMLEGTNLSEGRGTTRPLEGFGAPDINTGEILKTMNEIAPDWLLGCKLRQYWFEPTFHKHAGKLCTGIFIHADDLSFYKHEKFKPWRLMALAFKAIKLNNANYELWRDFPYEYETRLAIDIINGSDILRKWVDNEKSTIYELDNLAKQDEEKWENEREDFLIY